MTKAQLDKNYERFAASRQEKIRLEAALRGYTWLCGLFRNRQDDQQASEADLCEKAERNAQYAEYAAYLKKRVRPAMRALIENGDWDGIRLLCEEGITGGRRPEDYMQEASSIGRMDVWLAMYREKTKPGQTKEASAGKVDERKMGSGEKTSALAQRILRKCRMDLYGLFPAMNAAMAALPVCLTEEIETLGTDGKRLLVNTRFVIERYAKDPRLVRRLIWHTMLHCLLLHVVSGKGFSAEQNECRELAMDLYVEMLIEQECRKREECLKKLGTGMEDPDGAGCLKWLSGEIRLSQIESLLQRPDYRQSAGRFKQRFYPDEHTCWPKNETLTKHWMKIADQAGLSAGGRGYGGAGSEAGTDEDTLGQIKRSRRDYREFLRRFAVRREEAVSDPESFDYVYYTLGMEQLDQTPLIEPLEYREGHKLEELVIAIDTSWSCSADLVRRFLEECYAILADRENFFDTMNVYILQCDCWVQDAVCIRSREEWEKYCQNLVIKGRAGTDFRPVFKYIQKLRDEKKLNNPKALLYFTDGKGVYPRQAPDYETAFISLHRENGHEIPPWAISLELEKGFET